MRLYTIENNETVSVNLRRDDLLEKELEDFIKRNSEILFDEKLLIIGQQILTKWNKRIDLLAVDKSGNVVVIELKKGLAPRDSIAQILEYSSWLSSLTFDEYNDISMDYFRKNNLEYNSLTDAYQKYFQISEMPEIGQSIISVLFAEDFNDNLIDTIKYLNKSNLYISLIKFNWYRENDKNLIIIDDSLIETNFVIETSKSQKIISNFIQIKGITKKIRDYFLSNYQDWASNFNYNWKGFIAYNKSTGNWSNCYSTWKTDQGDISFSYTFSKMGEDHEGFQARIILPKEFISDNITEVKKLLNSNGFIKYTGKANGKFWQLHDDYTLPLKIIHDDSFNIEYIEVKKLIDDSFPLLKKIIELLLGE